VIDLPTADNPARVIVGDALTTLRSLPDRCIHLWVTSPPYWALRDYGVDGQIGLEKSPFAYVERLVEVFREARRVLRDDGTLWLNMGDSYAAAGRGGGGGSLQNNAMGREISEKNGFRQPPAGFKKKDICGMPWRLALALQADGWYLRSDLIWHKPNPMPSSVTDRPTTSHEYVFLLSKKERYYYDGLAIAEPATTAGKPIKMADGWDTGEGGHGAFHRNGREKGKVLNATQAETRNARSVWTISTESYPEAHFATFPTEIPRRAILAGTSEKGVCPACLAPWRRQVEKRRRPTRPGRNTKITACAASGTGSSGEYTSDGRAQPRSSEEVGNRDPRRHCTTMTTLGWEPSCKCAAGEPIPATVGDMFAGSGTTLRVAVQLKRMTVGIELNQEYSKLAVKRLAEPLGVGGLFDTGMPVVQELFV
jgi:DNA modification methylase